MYNFKRSNAEQQGEPPSSASGAVAYDTNDGDDVAGAPIDLPVPDPELEARFYAQHADDEAFAGALRPDPGPDQTEYNAYAAQEEEEKQAQRRSLNAPGEETDHTSDHDPSNVRRSTRRGNDREGGEEAVSAPRVTYGRERRERSPLAAGPGGRRGERGRGGRGRGEGGRGMGAGGSGGFPGRRGGRGGGPPPPPPALTPAAEYRLRRTEEVTAELARIPGEDASVETVLGFFRELLRKNNVVPPKPWRQIRFDLPATVAELQLYPPKPEQVQYTEPVEPSPCLVLLLEGTLPEGMTTKEYAAQMVKYLVDLLKYQEASTAITTLRFVKKGAELSQLVVTFARDVRQATRVLEQLQAAGITAGYGPPIEEYPPNATFQITDYGMKMHDGKGISASDIAFFLNPFRETNTVDINVIEGYEPGVFFAPVKRPETIYSFLWNPFCSFAMQSTVFDRYGVLVTMALCPHLFLQKGVPYYIQKQQMEEDRMRRLQQQREGKDFAPYDDNDDNDDAPTRDDGFGGEDDSGEDDEDEDVAGMARPAWALDAIDEVDIFESVAASSAGRDAKKVGLAGGVGSAMARPLPPGGVRVPGPTSTTALGSVDAASLMGLSSAAVSSGAPFPTATVAGSSAFGRPPAPSAVIASSVATPSGRAAPRRSGLTFVDEEAESSVEAMLAAHHVAPNSSNNATAAPLSAAAGQNPNAAAANGPSDAYGATRRPDITNAAAPGSSSGFPSPYDGSHRPGSQPLYGLSAAAPTVGGGGIGPYPYHPSHPRDPSVYPPADDTSSSSSVGLMRSGGRGGRGGGGRGGAVAAPFGAPEGAPYGGAYRRDIAPSAPSPYTPYERRTEPNREYDGAYYPNGPPPHAAYDGRGGDSYYGRGRYPLDGMAMMEQTGSGGGAAQYPQLNEDSDDDNDNEEKRRGQVHSPYADARGPHHLSYHNLQQQSEYDTNQFGRTSAPAEFATRVPGTPQPTIGPDGSRDEASRGEMERNTDDPTAPDVAVAPPPPPPSNAQGAPYGYGGARDGAGGEAPGWGTTAGPVLSWSMASAATPFAVTVGGGGGGGGGVNGGPASSIPPAFSQSQPPQGGGGGRHGYPIAPGMMMMPSYGPQSVGTGGGTGYLPELNPFQPAMAPGPGGLGGEPYRYEEAVPSQPTLPPSQGSLVDVQASPSPGVEDGNGAEARQSALPPPPPPSVPQLMEASGGVLGSGGSYRAGVGAMMTTMNRAVRLPMRPEEAARLAAFVQERVITAFGSSSSSSGSDSVSPAPGVAGGGGGAVNVDSFPAVPPTAHLPRPTTELDECTEFLEAEYMPIKQLLECTAPELSEARFRVAQALMIVTMSTANTAPNAATAETGSDAHNDVVADTESPSQTAAKGEVGEEKEEEEVNTGVSDWQLVQREELLDEDDDDDDDGNKEEEQQPNTGGTDGDARKAVTEAATETNENGDSGGAKNEEATTTTDTTSEAKTAEEETTPSAPPVVGPPPAAASSSDPTGTSTRRTHVQEAGRLPALLPYLLASHEGTELAAALATHFPAQFAPLLARYVLPYLLDMNVVQSVCAATLRADPTPSNPLVHRVLRHWEQLTQWLHEFLDAQAEQEATTVMKMAAKERSATSHTAANAETERRMQSARSSASKRLLSQVGNTMDHVLAALSPAQRSACLQWSNHTNQIAAFVDRFRAASPDAADSPSAANANRAPAGRDAALWGMTGAVRRTVVRLFLNADMVDGAALADALFAPPPSSPPASPQQQQQQHAPPPLVLTRDEYYFVIVALSKSQASPVLSTETAALSGRFLHYLEVQPKPSSTKRDGPGSGTENPLGEREAVQLLDAAFRSLASEEVFRVLREAYFREDDSQRSHGGKAGKPVTTHFPRVQEKLAKSTPPVRLQSMMGSGISALAYTASGNPYGYGYAPVSQGPVLSSAAPVHYAGGGNGPAMMANVPPGQQSYGAAASSSLPPSSSVTATGGGGGGAEAYGAAAAVMTGGPYPHLPMVNLYAEVQTSSGISWRPEWTAAMRHYPPIGEPFTPLPTGWVSAMSRSYGHYYFKPPVNAAGKRGSPTYKHPTDATDFIATPQAFLREPGNTTVTLADVVRVASEKMRALLAPKAPEPSPTAAEDREGKAENNGEAVTDSTQTTSTKQEEKERDEDNNEEKAPTATSEAAASAEADRTAIVISSDEAEAWLQDQRVRNVFLDLAVLELLKVQYRVGGGGASSGANKSQPPLASQTQSQQHTQPKTQPSEHGSSHAQPSQRKRSRSRSRSSSSSSHSASSTSKRSGTATGGTRSGSVAATLARRLAPIVRSYNALGVPFPRLPDGWEIAMSPATGLYTFRARRSQVPASSEHPKTRRVYRVSPQAFADDCALSFARIAQEARVSEDDVRNWMADQRRRHPAIDTAVVKMAGVHYVAHANLDGDEEAAAGRGGGGRSRGEGRSGRRRESSRRRS